MGVSIMNDNYERSSPQCTTSPNSRADTEAADVRRERTLDRRTLLQAGAVGLVLGGLGVQSASAETDEGPIDDVYNGDEVWRTGRTSGHRTPTVVDYVIYSVSGPATVMYTARTGESMLSVNAGGQGGAATVRDETFYGVGGGDRQIVRAYEAQGLDQTEGNRLGEYEFEERISDFEVGEDYVYAITGDDNHLYAVDRDLEDIEWDYDGVATRFAEPVYVDDRVVIAGGEDTSNEGKIHVLDAETGAVEWTDERDYELMRPTVDDGTVYCVGENRDGVELLWYDLETGDVEAATPDGIGSTSLRAPTVADDVMYFTANGLAYAIEPDGSVAWESEDLGIGGQLSVVDGTVLAGTSGGDDGAQLLALDGDTGDIEWASRYPDIGRFTTGMIVVGGMLFVAAVDHDFDQYLLAANAGVEGSSEDSNAQLGRGHHHGIDGAAPPEEPYILPLERPEPDPTPTPTPPPDDPTPTPPPDDPTPTPAPGDPTPTPTPAAEPTPTPEEDEDGIPGPGIIGTVGSLAGAGYVLKWWSDKRETEGD